jgi:predicted DNA-binding transcriptional regulator AlpA
MAQDANTPNLVLLDNQEAADFLKLSPRTLEKLRVTGNGPLFRKLGRRVLYARADLEAWVDARICTDTSDANYPGSE